MRVCITGIGGISPLGNCKASFKAIQQGKSGIKKLENLENLSCTIGGVVDIKCKRPKFIEMALAAASEALEDGKFSIRESDKIGVSCASGFGDLNEIVGSIDRHLNSKRLSPFTVPNMLINMAAGEVAIKYGFQGPLLAQSTACAASLQSIIDGYKAIKDNDAEYMLAGGAEASLTPFAINAFCRAKAITIKHNDSPESASQPFSPNRSGFVLSEGAAFVLLEKESTAIARNAPIYGYIEGYGMSCDAHHITTPGNGGAMRCIQMALKKSRNPQVDLVNCHATSTKIGDQVELDTIQALFPYSPRMVAYKRHLGHLLGAAGVFELCMGLQEDYTVQLKNSFGFGGVNASVVVSKT